MPTADKKKDFRDSNVVVLMRQIGDWLAIQPTLPVVMRINIFEDDVGVLARIHYYDRGKS